MSWKMSSVKMRLWTKTRLSNARSVAASNATYGPAPSRRVIPYISTILSVPKTTLGRRQPYALSPSTRIVAGDG